jgi:ribose 1,5-bisphosphate isomerase
MGRRWTVDTAPIGRVLRTVRSDRRRGATALAVAALEGLEEELQRWRRVDPPEVRRRLRVLARRWSSVQPSMAAFRTIAAVLARCGRSSRTTRAGAVRRVRRDRRRLEREGAALSARAARRLPGRAVLLTISRSATVRDTLAAMSARRRPTEVLALRSLPGGEGAAFARDLRRAGIRAWVVEDRDLATAGSRAELVLLGADAVLPNGDLVHKVGTRRLVRWARRHRIPAIVLAGRSKRLAPGADRLRISSGFDRTPRAWIRAIWS